MAALADGALTTIEQEYLRVLLLQLMNAGNLSPRHVEWVAEQLSEWCAPLRLNIESSTVTSFYVDLGARTGLRRRGPAAARRPRAVPRYAPAARDADAERRHARAEGAQRSAVGADAAPHRAAQPDDQARVRRSTPSSGRSRAAASARTRRERRRDRRIHQDRRLPARRGSAAADRGRQTARQFRRRRSRSRRSATCATKTRAHARGRAGGCSRPMPRPAAPGTFATCRKPAIGWSRR